MERVKRLPSRLYKYRELTARTLDMVVRDNLHFAGPSTFNDPLDTRPSVEADVDKGELGRILRILIERSTAAEMRAGAKAMKLEEPRTKDWIEQHSRREAERRIAEVEYPSLPTSLRQRLPLEIMEGGGGE